MSLSKSKETAMDAATRKNLERISVATVSMQLLKRGLRCVVMQGVRPLNRPAKPFNRSNVRRWQTIVPLITLPSGEY